MSAGQPPLKKQRRTKEEEVGAPVSAPAFVQQDPVAWDAGASFSSPATADYDFGAFPVLDPAVEAWMGVDDDVIAAAAAAQQLPQPQMAWPDLAILDQYFDTPPNYESYGDASLDQPFGQGINILNKKTDQPQQQSQQQQPQMAWSNLAMPDQFSSTPPNYEAQRNPSRLHPVCRGIGLSDEQVERLFASFWANQHIFVPFLDTTISVAEYERRSPLVFLCIITVAARRQKEFAHLLGALTADLPTIVWNALCRQPCSFDALQALILLILWPPPTASTASDISTLWAAMAWQIAVGLGVNRPVDLPTSPNEWARIRLTERLYRRATWDAVRVAVTSVSVGFGLRSPILFDEDDFVFVPPYRKFDPTRQVALHAIIEFYRASPIHKSLLPGAAAPLWSVAGQTAGDLLELMDRTAEKLGGFIEVAVPVSPTPTDDLLYYYLCAAQLHLRSFSLFGDSRSPAFDTQILKLFDVAAALLRRAVTPVFPLYVLNGPAFVGQTLFCAAFTVYHVWSNVHFGQLLAAHRNDETHRLLLDAVAAFKQMSLVPHDVPSRMAAVLNYFLSSHLAATEAKRNANNDDDNDDAAAAADVRPRISCRSSMSLVYDLLLRWRNHMLALAGQPPTAPGVFDSFGSINLFEGLDWFFTPPSI